MRPSKYNPQHMEPAERARLFTGRETELETLLGIIRDNTGRSSNQHVLVTGPRGIGKTMLLLRVADCLREDPDLSRRWFVVTAAEESYRVSGIGELWLEILFHLHRATQSPAQALAYEKIRAERDDRRLAAMALGALLDFADAQNKRLLVMVENLHMLFDGQLKEEDGWALRETLVGEPRIMLLASAVSSLAQIEEPNAALFEQFLVHPLGPLDTEGCGRLWQAATGHILSPPRSRALEILTGGNPRLLVMLSGLASIGKLRDLMADLIALIDDHTDYLKSNTEALPAVERKVFVALAELWRDSSAAEVAREARLEVNTTSAQLARLETRGAVVSARKGRSKQYRLAERLYNIYHLIRRRGDQSDRVRLVVEFMQAYYEPPEIKSRLRTMAEEALTLPAQDRRDHFLILEHIFLNKDLLNIRNEWREIIPAEVLACPDLPPGLKKLTDGTGPQAARTWPGKVEWPTDEELIKISVEEVEEPLLLLRKAALILSDLTEEEMKSSKTTLTLAPDLTLIKPERMTQALEATQKAVEKYEQLNAKAKASVLPALAVSLSFLSKLLDKLGRREEALIAAQRSVDIYERLAVANPAAYEPDLAMSLNNVGNRYSVLGRREEALSAAERSVEIYERLARANPAAYEPDLAMSLSNLGNCFSKLGRREEALSAAERAVEIYERLARANPAAYEPDLAMSLNNVGSFYSDLGRREEALSAAERAVEIRERLARANPAAYEPALASSLNNLGNRLSELDRKDEALSAAQKAVDIYEPLARLNPPVYKIGLAISLNNMGVYLAETADLLKAENRFKQALRLKPTEPIFIINLAELEIHLNWPVDASQRFVSLLALPPKELSSVIAPITELAVKLAAKGLAASVLATIKDSPASSMLEPLVVALEIKTGQARPAPLEVKEIARDIGKDIEARSGSSEPRFYEIGIG
ncbi:MAG: tetratricopeptide repeat protein [Thermodesulfobacteriota bacterium]